MIYCIPLTNEGALLRPTAFDILSASPSLPHSNANVQRTPTTFERRTRRNMWSSCNSLFYCRFIAYVRRIWAEHKEFTNLYIRMCFCGQWAAWTSTCLPKSFQRRTTKQHPSLRRTELASQIDAMLICCGAAQLIQATLLHSRRPRHKLANTQVSPQPKYKTSYRTVVTCTSTSLLISSGKSNVFFVGMHLWQRGRGSKRAKHCVAETASLIDAT